jgi:hypothetical protein
MYWLNDSGRPALFSSLPVPSPGQLYYAQPIGMALDVGVLIVNVSEDVKIRVG